MQKFEKFDLVRISKNLGSSMDHFQSDCDAIVEGSYGDFYGCGDYLNYKLFLRGRGGVSWYKEHQLTLIKRGQSVLFRQWEQEITERNVREENLDWIFEHGKEVAKAPTGASIAALAGCMGIYDLWGKSGEGITYYANALAVISAAQPFLNNADKAGWLAHCEKSAEIIRQARKLAGIQ